VIVISGCTWKRLVNPSGNVTAGAASIAGSPAGASAGAGVSTAVGSAAGADVSGAASATEAAGSSAGLHPVIPTIKTAPNRKVIWLRMTEFLMNTQCINE